MTKSPARPSAGASAKPPVPCPRGRLRKALTGLRRLFSDDSYERYREAQARVAPDEPPLDRRAFKARQILMTLGRGCCGR